MRYTIDIGYPPVKAENLAALTEAAEEFGMGTEERRLPNMDTMTSRQRMLAAMRNEQPDRVPAAPRPR